MSVDDLAQKFGGLNTETISYLKSAKRGEASLEGLSASMTSASISTKLLSVALNALSGLAISLIIKGFTWALDELIVTLDEQKEKLDEAVTAYEESKSELEQINDELKTTGERIDELNGKDNLTFTEQDELEKLIKTNDELERKIYLLEQANKEAEKEVATEAQNTYDKYTNDRTLGAVEQIEFYADSSLLEGVNWDNFKSDLSWLVAQYKNQEEILANAQINGWTTIEEQAKSNLALLEGYMSEASLDYQDLYDKISGISDYAMTDDLKVAKQDLDDILDIVAEILGYGGQRSETSFDDIWNSEDFTKYKTELETLAKEGKLDASVLESNENYKKLLDDTGTTAEDTAQHINALVDEIGKTGQEANKIDDSRTSMISSINKLSEGFEELDKIYADIQDKGSFDFKLFDDDNFKKNFSGLESYSDFIESVTNSPNDIEKCQSAFNALVTEWIDDTKVLDNLTEANEDLTVSMLEQMGVSNAQEVVNQKFQQLKAAQLNAKIATEATTDEVLRQIGAWINEGEAIGYTKTALFDLISTERIFNNSNLNVAGKIAQLEQLALSFGITADAAGTAGLKMSMLNEIKIGKRDGYSKEDIKKLEESYLNYARSQYQKTFEDRFGKLKTFNYSGSTKSNKTKSNKTSSIKKQVAEIFDWIEVRMSRLKRNIKNLSDTVSNTFKSWSTRRKSLKKEISEISKALSAQKSASAKYLKKANSVDLSESYKKKVREGKIDIESIKDEKLKEKIKKYQEYYQAYLNSKDAEKELEKQLSEAYREQFDLIESEYEGKISLIESNITALENAISLAEAKGKQVGSSYYDDIIAAERERIAALGNEYQALQAQLDAMVASGQIVKYSEEWYAMQNEINQVKQSWDEANISLEQYLQNQREADWSIFDSNQEKISDVANDNSFLLGLLEDEDMYDENGNITDFGNAANGLRLANMDLYTQQLENYTDELARLEEEYDDKSNTYYLERKRELIEAQQEAINAIKDERQALIDLAKEGYDALLDHMQKIIDKRKEAFNEIKDLRDYEKSIKEQTDEIDVIQKQLIAYQGDDSEESRSTIQKLQQSLKEAQDNLEETQYDKYIKDQEQMYDKLMEDTQNWVDELFENESALLQGIIDNATANSDRIISIVKQIAEQAGYTIQDEQSTELTDVLQREGYARGSKNIPYKQNNWIHAGELLYRTTDGGLLMPLNSGDKVFTSAMAENLWDMAQMNLHPVVPNYDVSPLVNKVIGSNTWSGDVVFNVEMYGVNDPQEFARQIKLVYSNNTGNVRNMIQTDVFSGDMLAHKKYL